MSTIDLTADNFDSTIRNNQLVLIDFWASWCGPCRSFAPIFSAAAEKHPAMVFAKVDTEAQQQLAAQFQIRSIPTLGGCPRIENLLRKSPFGPFYRSFSLNMSDYSHQMIEKLASKWLPLATAPILGQPPSDFQRAGDGFLPTGCLARFRSGSTHRTGSVIEHG